MSRLGRWTNGAVRGAQALWKRLPKPVRDYYIGILSVFLMGGAGAVEKSGLADLTPGFEIPGVSVQEPVNNPLPPSQVRNLDPKTLKRDISGLTGLLQVGFDNVVLRAKTTSVTGLTVGDSVNKIYTEHLNLDGFQARHLDITLTTCSTVEWDNVVVDGQSLDYGAGTPPAVGIAVAPSRSDFTFVNQGADAGSIDLPTADAEVETILLRDVSTDADALIQNIVADHCTFRNLVIGEGDGTLSPDLEIASNSVFGPATIGTPTVEIENTEVR